MTRRCYPALPAAWPATLNGSGFPVSSFILAALILAFGLSRADTARAQNPPPVTPTPPAEATPLQLNVPVERELASGQTHVYEITLADNQYFYLNVEQRGVDVSVALLAPGGAQLLVVDSPNGREGPEEIKAAFPDGGVYRVEVKALEQNAPAGRYLARLAEVREATPVEIKRTRATLAQNEGLQLRNQRTPAALRQAIAKFEEAAQLAGEIGDKKDQGLATHEKGLTHQLLGEYDVALEIYRQAIVIEHEAGDFANEGTTTSNIGFIYNRLVDYQRALFYFHRSLEIESQRPDLEPYQTLPLANIAAIYRTLGDYPRAIAYYRQALTNARKHKQPNNESSVLLNLAAVFAEAGEYQQGLEAQLQILPYWKAHRDRGGEVLALGYIGDAYFYLSDYPKALDYYRQQYQLGVSAKILDGMARGSFGLGKTYLRQGDVAEARTHLREAQELFARDAKSLSLVLLWLASAERQAGQYAEAENYLRQAVELIEAVRNRISAQDLRTAFFSRSNRDIYDSYIALLLERHLQDPTQGYDRRAFEMSEKARARTLLELLAVAQVDIRQGVDPALLERERGQRKQLSDKAAQVSRLVLARATEDKIAAANSDYAKAEEELQSIESRIRQASPRYAALTQAQTISLIEAQTKLLDKDTALLEYSLGEKRSCLWVVTGEGLKTFELPKRDDIEPAARKVYEALTERNKVVKFETMEEKRRRLAQAEAALPPALTALSRMILAPAAALLARKRLLIVPDGALHYVPFAALPLGSNGAPLVAEHEVVNLPSASTLAVLRQDLTGRPPAPKALAVFADPVFSKNDERYQTIAAKTGGTSNPTMMLAAQSRGVELSDFSDLTRASGDVDASESGVTLARLPFTRQEANFITSIATPGQNKTELDFRANRAGALDPELAQYRIIHFATHGLISNTHPEVSGLVLSLIDENGQEQNGFIRASDIYNLRLPADLVVLSGCRTGLGKQIRGEGLVGLTQSFMYAGAARVVVSLWDINDAATAELMRRFYQKMLGPEKLSPAAALRAAQMSLRQDKRWASPYYWAAFTLQGEPR